MYDAGKGLEEVAVLSAEGSLRLLRGVEAQGYQGVFIWTGLDRGSEGMGGMVKGCSAESLAVIWVEIGMISVQ